MTHTGAYYTGNPAALRNIVLHCAMQLTQDIELENVRVACGNARRTTHRAALDKS